MISYMFRYGNVSDRIWYNPSRYIRYNQTWFYMLPYKSGMTLWNPYINIFDAYTLNISDTYVYEHI